MIVILAPRVEDELLEIYVRTARNFGIDGADRYDAFLRERLAGLVHSHLHGRRIEGHPELQRMTFKRRAGGEGHIAVYEVNEDAGTVEVLRLFHTRMDLPARLRDDPPTSV